MEQTKGACSHISIVRTNMGDDGVYNIHKVECKDCKHTWYEVLKITEDRPDIWN